MVSRDLAIDSPSPTLLEALEIEFLRKSLEIVLEDISSAFNIDTLPVLKILNELANLDRSASIKKFFKIGIDNKNLWNFNFDFSNPYNFIKRMNKMIKKMNPK